MDRQPVMSMYKQAMVRGFTDELLKIAHSRGIYGLEKFASDPELLMELLKQAGLFDRAGKAVQKVVQAVGRKAKSGYERAQIAAGNVLSGHGGHSLTEAATEGLQHGGMFMGMDAGDIGHALSGGAEAAAARLLPMAVPAGVAVARKAAPYVRRAGQRVAQTGREWGEALRSYTQPGPPGALVPAFAG